MLSFSCICRKVLDTSSIQPGHLGPRCNGDLMWFVGLSDQNYVGFKWISAIVPWRQLEGANLFRCHSRGCRKVASDSFETRLYSMLLTCITPSQEYQPIRIINIIMPSICQVGIQEQCEHTSHSSQSQPAIKKRTSRDLTKSTPLWIPADSWGPNFIAINCEMVPRPSLYIYI